MTPAPTATAIDLDLFPTTDRIFGYIADLTAWGHRRTGTPEGRRSARYIADAFTAAGLTDVTIETAPTPCPFVHRLGLAVAGVDLPAFWANGTGRSAQLGRFDGSAPEGAEIVYLGAGWPEDFEGVDVRGKVVLCDIEFLPASHRGFLEAHPGATVYDPDGTLEEPRTKYDIYSPNNWPGNYFAAQLKGAVGFVGALQNYMDCNYYNEDYSENGRPLGIDAMSIPAVWVSRDDGRRIAESIRERAGAAPVRLEFEVEYELKDALNVHGILPGASPEVVLVHSHHDAVFAGAVQDASGISEVLALAEYFAKVPTAQRSKTMMFAATDTHFTDYVAHRAFLAAREESRDRIVLDICVEHVAKEIELDADNHDVETGFVEPRIVYVSESTGLLPVVEAAFRRMGLTRTIFTPANSYAGDGGFYEFRPDEVVSDAYYFVEAGIPTVSLLSGPMYLFHPSDTADRVAKDQLRPIGIALAEIAVEASNRL